jgi:hypothetical protein
MYIHSPVLPIRIVLARDPNYRLIQPEAVVVPVVVMKPFPPLIPKVRSQESLSTLDTTNRNLFYPEGAGKSPYKTFVPKISPEERKTLNSPFHVMQSPIATLNSPFNVMLSPIVGPPPMSIVSPKIDVISEVAEKQEEDRSTSHLDKHLLPVQKPSKGEYDEPNMSSIRHQNNEGTVSIGRHMDRMNQQKQSKSQSSSHLMTKSRSRRRMSVWPKPPNPRFSEQLRSSKDGTSPLRPCYQKNDFIIQS